MADNIKIVGQVLDTSRVNRYDAQDEQLLLPIIQQETFGKPEDYVEYFVFDLGGNILNSNYNYNSYKLPSNYSYSQSYLPTLEIDPIQDIENLGYESGGVTSRYNFFRKVSGEPFSTQLFISQISSDRTELRVSSTELNDIVLIDIASNFADKQLAVPYYYYVILNFGNNNQVIAVNILSEVNANGDASLLLKLYEPLPANIALRDTFWIVEEIINPYIYDLSLNKLITPLPQPNLKGPNFSIDLEFKNVVPTQYSNLTQLITSFTGSSYQATLNSLTNQEVNINVDYSLLNDFVHYSSAENRVNNFMYKIGEIEGYQYEISTFSPLTASNASLINQVNKASSSLNATIAGFDGFESYLYYTSSSLTSSIVQYNLETGSYLAYNIAPYPKSNSTQPYTLYASSSTIVTNWYNDTIEVATTYDIENKDILTNTIPSYIIEDPGNYLPYIVFVNMIGQYFDNIWVYIDKVTDVWDNNNNINEGISQDLVYDWLRSFGMKLYNSQGNQDVLNYNVGGFSGSVDFNGDYSPSSSFLNNIPRKELVIDTYKRLYHNLPYLFKGKGAHGGLQGLITLFGITGSILPIKEYGGTNDYQDLKGYSPNKISLGSNNLTGSILSPIKRFETSTTSSREVKSQDLHFIDVSFSPQTQIDSEVSASITAVDPNWIIDNYIAYPEALYLDTYPSLSYQRDYWFGQTFTHPSEGFDYGGFIRLIQFFDNSLFKMVKDFTPARGNTWTGVSIKSPVLERPKVPEAQPIFTNFPDLEGEVTGAALLPVYDPYYFRLAGDREPYYTGNITGSFIDTYAYFEETNRNPYLVNNTIGYVPPGFVSGNTDFILNYKAPAYENFFINSDFNALQNNEFVSLTSQFRKKLVPILTVDSLGRVFTSYSVTESVQLQDSYLSDTAYVNSRYEGVRLFGKQYNNWSPGDVSYGLTPVINYNTKKLGLFTEVVKSIIPNKSNVALKYLVDDSGGLIELNQRNRNWEEVQNTFKTGETLNVSLFNPQQYSNQSITNGNKIIHESGYNYYPVLYAFGDETGSTQVLPFFDSTNTLGLASVNFFNKKLSTRQIPLPGVYSSPLVTIGTTNIPLFNHTSSFTTQSVVWTEVWDIFNPTQSVPPGNFNSNGNYQEIGWAGFNAEFFGSPVPAYSDPPYISYASSYLGSYLYPGVGPGVSDINSANVTSSYYIIPTEGEYDFSYRFDVGVVGDVGATFTSSLELWVSSSTTGNVTFITRDSQSIKIPPSTYAASTTVTVQQYLDYNAFSAGYINYLQLDPSGFDIQVLAGDLLSLVSPTNPNASICSAPLTQNIPGGNPQAFTSDQIFKKYKYRFWTRNSNGSYVLNSKTVWSSDYIDLTNNSFLYAKYYANFSQCDITKDIQFVKHNNVVRIQADGINYKPNDKIIFKYLIKTTAAGGSIIRQAGIKYYTNDIVSNQNNYAQSFLSVAPSVGSLGATFSICNDQTDNALVLGPQLSTFYSPNFYFFPTYAPFSASFNQLVNELGDINYPFQLSPYDKVIVEVGANGGIYYDYTIFNVYTNANGQITITFFEDLDARMVDTLCNTFYKIYFLKRVPDETNIILNLRKPLGKTSYGLIIPQNLSQNVLNNIDNITKNVKLQLLDAGSNVIT